MSSSDDLRKDSERPPKFLLLCNRVRSHKLIIAYHVYYDYYEIDRNQQLSKITVHETDILNSHFTELFYRQCRAFFKNSSVGGGGHPQKGTILYQVWRNDRWLLVTKDLVWYRI